MEKTHMTQKSVEEHIDILRRAVRSLLSQHAPVTGDLEERYDIGWPAREEERLKVAREAAVARLKAAQEAEARSKDKAPAESPSERAARLNREQAEAEVAALQGSPNMGAVGEPPAKTPSRGAKP
jgi:hypothetical protein